MLRPLWQQTRSMDPERAAVFLRDEYHRLRRKSLVRAQMTQAIPIFQHTSCLTTCYAAARLRQEHSLLKLKRDHHFLDVIGALAGAFSEQHYNVNAHLYYHAAAYVVNGFRSYEVSSELGEMLRHTELQGLNGRDLQPPYRSLYIDVPLTTGLRVWNDETGWHPLRGVYLSVDNETGELMEPGRTLRAMVVGQWTFEKFEGYDVPDDALLYWHVPLVDDWPLDRCIQQHKNTARDYAGRYPSSLQKMHGEWDAIFTWIVNVLMYSTSWQHRAELRHFDPRAEVLRRRLGKAKNPKRRKAVADEMGQVDQRRYTRLGLGMPSLSAGKGAGRPLEKRVLVSGHWRNQAVGPKWSERRRILIEPFWRGPEDAADESVPHRLV
jgi:hypothetical protein